MSDQTRGLRPGLSGGGGGLTPLLVIHGYSDSTLLRVLLSAAASPECLIVARSGYSTPVILCSCHAEEDREMASALQELLGASVVDGTGNTVAVSSLAGNDKVLGL